MTRKVTAWEIGNDPEFFNFLYMEILNSCMHALTTQVSNQQNNNWGLIPGCPVEREMPHY